MKKLFLIILTSFPLAYCNAQIKSKVQRTTLSNDTKSNANTRSIVKVNTELEKTPIQNTDLTPKFGESKSLWSDWITSEDYPKDIAVRYSQLKYSNISMEVKNIGYGTVVGEFYASDCQNENGNSANYQKINIEAGRSQKITFTKKDCNNSSNIRWWWKNLYVWSPKKAFEIGWFNNTSYKSITRWAKKGNNKFILEIHLTEEPYRSQVKYYNTTITGRITACFCYQPYDYINGWQNFVFTVSHIYYFDFEDKSNNCDWETKNDLNITIHLDKSKD